MKQFLQTTRISLLLLSGLPLLAGHAQAAPALGAPISPLARLSAKLQASPQNNGDKYSSTTFDPTPVLSGSQNRLNGAEAAPKRLFINPQTTLAPAPKTGVRLQLKQLSRHLGKDNASPKRLSTQISATPNWK